MVPFTTTTTTTDGTRMGILHRAVPSSQEENGDGKHHGASGCIQPAKSLSCRLRSLGVLLPRAPMRIRVGHLTDRQGSVGHKTPVSISRDVDEAGSERCFPSAIRLVKFRSRKRRGAELHKKDGSQNGQVRTEEGHEREFHGGLPAARRRHEPPRRGVAG